jgi:hypothetical protein
MINPFFIAVKGYLSSLLGIATDGYISSKSLCDETIYNVPFFRDLGYSINDVIIVYRESIKIKQSGTEVIMTYFGNNVTYHKKSKLTTKEKDLCEFVFRLNSIPIIKPKGRRC